MTAITHPTGPPLRSRASPRGPLPLIAVIALAWAAMIAMAIPGGGQGEGGMAMSMPGMRSMPGMQSMPGMSGRTSGIARESMFLGTSIPAGLAMWITMILAMMLPATLPAIRHVAHNSLRHRRRTASLTFVVTYLTIWTTFGLLIVLLYQPLRPLNSAPLAALALALAAVWQLTPHKRQAMRDCHRTVALPPHGRKATTATIRFGLMNGFACLRSCWAMMLAMALATTGSLIWMLSLTAVTLAERRDRRPRHAAKMTAQLLTLGTIVVAATSLP